jgi:hypothetical protein
MTGLTNMPAGTDGTADPEGEVDVTGAEDAGAPDKADEGVPADPGGFVTLVPEHACARTTVTSAIDLRGDPAARIVNPSPRTTRRSG